MVLWLLAGRVEEFDDFLTAGVVMVCSGETWVLAVDVDVVGVVTGDVPAGAHPIVARTSPRVISQVRIFDMTRAPVTA